MNILVKQNEMVSLRDTNYAARRRRIQQNFLESQKAVLSESATLIHQKEESISQTNSRLAEQFGFSAKKREHRRAISEEIERHQGFLKDMLMESLCEAFYDSIILDESFKEKFSESIMESAETFLEEAFKQKLINVSSFAESKSITMRELYRISEMAYEAVSESSEDIDLILEAAKSKRKNAISNIADNVKSKVAKVVKNEKKIADDNKKQLDDLKMQEHVVQRREVPSLFKSIMISNSRNPISESGSETNTVNMDMIFAESIIQYTLLEMMNTTRLIDLTAREAQRLAFDYQYAK